MENLDTKEALMETIILLCNVIEWAPSFSEMLLNIISGFIQIATCSLNQSTLLIWLHAERSIGSYYDC